MRLYIPSKNDESWRSTLQSLAQTSSQVCGNLNEMIGLGILKGRIGFRMVNVIGESETGALLHWLMSNCMYGPVDIEIR